MPAGLTRREQWVLIAMVLIIGGGLGARQWLGREPGAGVYVEGQTTWQTVAGFNAGEPVGELAPAPPEVTPEPADVLAPGGIELNTATPAELERIRGIGPATAAAILAWREAHGGFASVDQLIEVKGIGPAKLGQIAPYVRIEGAPLTPPAEPGEMQATPQPIRVNHATAAELEALPGIGPVLAGRIIEERTRAGGFTRPEDLLRVHGIGPKTLETIRGRIALD